jgi:two-component system response regulator NreC
MSWFFVSNAAKRETGRAPGTPYERTAKYVISPVTSIKVVVADDSDVVRRAIRHLLQEHPEIELVGEATSFEETIQMTNDFKPHVVVMDVYMDRNNGESLTGTVSKLSTFPSRIVAISIFNDEQTKKLAESFGAVTLLDKIELSDILIPTIQKFAAPPANL